MVTIEEGVTPETKIDCQFNWGSCHIKIIQEGKEIFLNDETIPTVVKLLKHYYTNYKRLKREGKV